MYNRLNKIINKIKSLGSTRWGRREVVDKILSAYMARDVQLPTLIREKRGFNKFTPADVIGRMEEHLITVKESKLSQEMSKMHEQLEKNKGVALKASSKEKRSSSSTSRIMAEEDDDEDSDMDMTPEQMALFVRKFNKMFKRSGFLNKNKDKDKIKTKRSSKRPCFGCGKEGHFIAECPNIKVRRRDTNKFDKNKRKEVGEAHLGEEWDSNDDSSDSDIEAGLATITIKEPINKSSLFEDLTDDEDDFTHTCLMARGSKVDTPTPPLDDDSENDFDFEKMITSFGKKATKKIMFLMKEIENRDGTLEVQEELFRLEREKTIALEDALVIEKKGFKVQEDLLKEKEKEILSLNKSLAKDKLLVDELTRESFLAKDACKKLENEKLELQKSIDSLKTSHIALEVQLDNLKNNATTLSNDAPSNSQTSTSKGCSRCYKFDINACATNVAEMNAMRKEIARLSNSLIVEKKKEPKRGEFENHTKGFGSSYMKKFGFEDGKGLGKQEQGTKDPIPFIKNHHTKGMGTRNVVHGMKQMGVKKHDNQVRYNTPIKFKSTQVTSQASHTKPNKSMKKPKPHASQDSFYADYVLTWNHKGKVVAKYVGPRTKGTMIKRSVWVPKILVTNTLGPKFTWVPKTQA
jgi:hypothetical protein